MQKPAGSLKFLEISSFRAPRNVADLRRQQLLHPPRRRLFLGLLPGAQRLRFMRHECSHVVLYPQTFVVDVPGLSAGVFQV